MDNILKVFLAVFFFFAITYGSISIISANIKSNQAVNYKMDVINEIENSNFNEDVINACKEQATVQGYSLDVKIIKYDNNHNATVAEVILSYDYELPIFNIKTSHQTSGYAR